MERKIGETFKYDGKTYKAIEEVTGCGCTGCAFENKGCINLWAELGVCGGDVREDKKGVIFIKVKPEEKHDAVEEVMRLMPNAPFDAILKEMSELHAKKNADYGNAFAKRFERLEARRKGAGLENAVSRIGDKYERLENLAYGNEAQVKDESIRETLIDLACYAVMTIEEIDKKK